MNEPLYWFKAVATSGAWFSYVLAASAEEAVTLHTKETSQFPHLAHRYSGPFHVVAVTLQEIADWLGTQNDTTGLCILSREGAEHYLLSLPRAAKPHSPLTRTEGEEDRP
jgi:hypothetical protein